MNDYPRDLLIKENIIRDMEDMMDVRFINKTESAEALKQHDAEIRRRTLNEVESAMYHEAFNIDHEVDGMQKWDGGNWIRYKLFENVMEQMKGGAE